MSRSEDIRHERPIRRHHPSASSCFQDQTADVHAGPRSSVFSPFAALTGYDAAISETGRLTDERTDLGEETKAMLDMKQQYLLELISDQPEITVTYFVRDEKKAGGAYVTVTGNLKRIDDYVRLLILTNGKKIPMDEIADIESDIFKGII